MPAVQDAFRQVLEMMAGAFAANLRRRRDRRAQRALALVAMAVGAMVLARAVTTSRRWPSEIRRSGAQRGLSTGWGLREAAAAAA